MDHMLWRRIPRLLNFWLFDRAASILRCLAEAALRITSIEFRVLLGAQRRPWGRKAHAALAEGRMRPNGPTAMMESPARQRYH